MHRGHNGAIVLLRTLNSTLYYSELKMTEQLSKHVFNFKSVFHFLKNKGILLLHPPECILYFQMGGKLSYSAFGCKAGCSDLPPHHKYCRISFNCRSELISDSGKVAVSIFVQPMLKQFGLQSWP